LCNEKEFKFNQTPGVDAGKFMKFKLNADLLLSDVEKFFFAFGLADVNARRNRRTFGSLQMRPFDGSSSIGITVSAMSVSWLLHPQQVPMTFNAPEPWVPYTLKRLSAALIECLFGLVTPGGKFIKILDSATTLN
jgi:hypothetical protein